MFTSAHCFLGRSLLLFFIKWAGKDECCEHQAHVDDACLSWEQEQCQRSEHRSDLFSVARSFAKPELLEQRLSAPAASLKLEPLETFGWSDPSVSKDEAWKKYRINFWVDTSGSHPMHTGWEVVCVLGMTPRSSRFVCPENHPWPKEIFEAQCKSRTDEVESVFQDSWLLDRVLVAGQQIMRWIGVLLVGCSLNAWCVPAQLCTLWHTAMRLLLNSQRCV